MFNAPRPIHPYGTSAQSGPNFVTENPLISSVYDDGIDPWSNSPSPTPPPLPSFPASSSGFSSVIGDANVPLIYDRAFLAVNPSNTGETSVNALSRVLGTSSIPASTMDKIVSLVSSRPRVSRLEFFVALALAALAQGEKELSIERVAALAQQNALPEPTLDLDSLPSSTSTFPETMRIPFPPTRGYSTEDPWNSKFASPSTVPKPSPALGSISNGAPSNISGTGLPHEWWKKQDTVFVNVLGQQGFILNRYLVYEVSSDRGTPVSRRYSEFVFLWDVLVKRYPFRLLPTLPPKRIGREYMFRSARSISAKDGIIADESFLEQRRRGLTRFINFVVNHPVIKEDAVLRSFLTEPSLEEWRKHTAIYYDEESISKRVDRIEEMTIPSDLEDKLAVVRGKIGFLIEHWQRICLLTERIVRRREAAAVRLTPVLRPSFLPTHLHLPPFASLISGSSSSSSATSGSDNADASTTPSIFSGFASGAGLAVDGQADLSRLTNSFKSLVEVNERCWRGEDCELCAGVRQGLVYVSAHTQRQADAVEHRSRTMLYATLEALKGQRDLYVAMRDLFIRHDRLSPDQVDRFRKRVDTNSHKLEGIRQARKEGWEQEADKVAGLIEKDQAAITTALNRRIFIRACMWHELRVVLHNRENTLLTQTVQSFAREEHDFSEAAAANWLSLLEAAEGMPFE